jgi:hypothetical protein
VLKTALDGAEAMINTSRAQEQHKPETPAKPVLIQ